MRRTRRAAALAALAVLALVCGGVFSVPALAGVSKGPSSDWTPGGACSPDGTITINNTNILTCTSGVWAITGGGSGAVSTGSAGQVAYYASTGTTVIGTSTINIVNGLVGIGTTGPLNKLNVQADAGGLNSNWLLGQLVISGNSNNNQRLYLGYDTTNNQGVIQAGLNNTGYEPLLLNPSGGNVGIFNTNPQAKLSVGATTNYSIDTGYAIHAVDAANVAKRLALGYDDTINAGVVQSVYSGNSWQSTLINPNGGNVGIGTTNPAYTLQVNGSISSLNDASGYSYVAGVAGAERFAVEHSSGWGVRSRLTKMGVYSFTNGYALATPDTGISRYWTNVLAVGNGTQGDYSGTLIAGNVGIGTTSPTALLTVEKDSIANAATDGLLLQNLTASTSGTQQYSPVLHFIGQGWKTNSTAANQQTEWLVQNQNISGGAGTNSSLVFTPVRNGAAGYSVYFCQGDGSQSNLSSGTGLFGLDGSNTGCNNNAGFNGLGSVGAANTFGIYTNASNRISFGLSSFGIQGGYEMAWFSGAPANLGGTPDVGLSRNAAGVLELNNGKTLSGTGSLATLIAGSVGIGTTSPSTPLQVYQNTYAQTGLTVTSGSAGSETGITLNGSGLQTGIYIPSVSTNGTGINIGGANTGIGVSANTYGAGGKSINASAGGGSTAIYAADGGNGIAGYFTSTGGGYSIITGQGNVGIGTTSPQAALHVYGETTLAGSGYYQILAQASSHNYEGIAFEGPGGYHGALRVENGDGFSLLGNSGGNISGYLLRVTNSGNVGIGTTAPDAAALLHMESTAKGFLPPRLTTANETAMGTSLPMGLVAYNTTNNELESFNGTAWEAVGANAADAAGSTGQVQFNNSGDLGADSNFFWDNTNKRLGIGTTTPQSTLAISGGVAIGLTFAGSTAAPSSDLLVQNSIGIGTTSPIAPLSVYPPSGLVLTGTSSPNLNGSFSVAGTYHGTNYYQGTSGGYMWWDGGSSWIISSSLGVHTADYYNSSGNSTSPPLGTYIAEFGASGSATLASGTASTVAVFGGNVGIGTTVPAYLLHVGSSSASDIVVEFQNSSGACTHNPASGTEIVSCSSDARLKTNIRDSGDALEWLGTMRIRDFTVKSTGEARTGVVAQEMQPLHPDMVHKGPDGLYKVEQPNPWKLIKAIQELKALFGADHDEISKLKADNEGLRAANDNQSQEMARLKAENAALAVQVKAANDNEKAELKALRDEFRAYKAAHP